MKSIYDVLSLCLFAGIAVLFLQRSAAPEPDSVALWRYAVAAVGCAVADVLGNNGLIVPSIAIFVATTAFALLLLKPFGQGR